MNPSNQNSNKKTKQPTSQNNNPSQSGSKTYEGIDPKLLTEDATIYTIVEVINDMRQNPKKYAAVV